jgi:carboxyl-terminal processing protease
MRAEEIVRKGWWAAALLVGSLFTTHFARADDPKPTTPAAAKAEAPALADDSALALERGLELERKRSWSEAVRFYENALKQWPSKVDFGHRLTLCEIHLKISRRYQDRSFRDVMLKLSQEKATDLFDELIDRIEHYYVEPVALENIVRRGYDNLEVALRDPNFLKINATTDDAGRVNWLRDSLRNRRQSLEVVGRQAARSEISAACELAHQGLGINPAPVILEFVYGACDVLDPYSNCLTPDKLEDMFTMIDGNFVGLGVELKHDDLGLKVVGVIRGGPAADAGLKSGDKIVAIAGRSVKGLGLDESAGQLQGTEGTAVDINVLRADGTVTPFRIVRRHVDVASVEQAKIVDKVAGVGYIRLTGFQKTSTDEVDRAIKSLQRQGMKYLVLDLRGNPGGLLNVAVELADRFVDRGVIVSTRGRAPGQSQTYHAHSDVAYAMPMAVLIDRDSASASEILAGALKELNRAVIVGDRKSYGKGSVQSIYELRSAPAGLKLTTAQFYSPTNRPYSEQGVHPDIIVKVDLKPAADRNDDEPVFAFEIGSIEDPVLKRAILQAQQRAPTTR